MRVLIVATLDTSALCRLPRLFHDAGYEVDLMGPEGLTAMRSRWRWAPGTSPRVSPPA